MGEYFNNAQRIKDVKDQRCRSKDQYLQECLSHIVTKDQVSSEQYQMYKIMSQTDNFESNGDS